MIKTLFRESFRNILYLLAYPFFLKKVKKFKDIHHGEEAYIIADSSELRLMDLTVFDDLPAICFNFSFFINDILNRTKPTYTHLIESFYFYKYFTYEGNRLNITKSLKNVLDSRNFVFFTNLTNILNFFLYDVYYLFMTLPEDKFTKKIKQEDKFVTSLSIKTAISLAIYMGFKKVYLVGFSFHSESLAHHWYDDLPIENFRVQYGKPAQEMIRKSKSKNYFFEEANKSIEIVGVTPFKPEESYFPYVLYENHFGKKIQLRSPFEMTDFHDILLFKKLETDFIKEHSNRVIQ
jgi:hypothetical protein